MIVLLIVAVPAATSAFFAVAAFSGCFIECSQPEPAVGLLWAAISFFLLVLPLGTGFAVARVPLARAWPWLLGVAILLLVSVLFLQRVV